MKGKKSMMKPENDEVETPNAKCAKMK